MLDTSKKLVAVRYEGAQDIDLRYADGKEKYVQIKNEINKRYTLKELHKILLGFAEDWMKASRNENLSFELVARSSNIDAQVTRLKLQTPEDEDLTTIREILVQSSQYANATHSITALSNNEQQELARNFLRKIIFSFGMGDEISNRLSFEVHTYAELARHGVSSNELQSAFLKLTNALQPKRTFSRVDIQEILKPFIGKAATDIFNGRVEALTSDLLSHPANDEQIQYFYGGAPVGWDIIAANGDIPRDQQEDLIGLLREPSNTPRLYCLVAEPGAGKSTFARRVVAELYRRYNALVLHIKSEEDIEPWYLMKQFYSQVQRPFYILVDDVFRYSEINNVINNLNSSLPITILATSRKNEYRPRLNFKTEPIPLEAPNINEKERILQRLGKSRSSLTPEQQKRLDNANQFLVLMMELKTGKELHEIIRDVLERLRKNDESIYRAFEYLCFSSLHSVSIPESLLEHLDARGGFYKLSEKDAAQGLIFLNEGRTNSLRAGHPLIAEVAFEIYGRSPVNVLNEIVKATDVSNYSERNYITFLLRAEAVKESSIIQNALPQIQTVIEECKRLATISELSVWRNFYLALKQNDLADRCIDEALARDPVSSQDCNMMLWFFRLRNREKAALPVIAKWFKNNPDEHGAREAFLGLVENYGNSEDIKTAIIETSKWLVAHENSTSARTFYLGLVERRGTSKQVEQAIDETSLWLAIHQNDTNVRTFYLGLVERRGTSKQVEQAIDETSLWLAIHQNDTNVRTFYLGLVERRGTSRLVENVLSETKVWLQKHSNATGVWGMTIALLIRLDRIEEAGALAIEAISLHPDNSQLNNQYLSLFKNSEDKESVRNLFEKLIKSFPQDIMIRHRFAAWLCDHEQIEDARRIYERLTKESPRYYQGRHGYGRLLLKEESYIKAAKEFQAALNIHQGYEMAHDGFAYAMSKIGEMAEANGQQESAKGFYKIAEDEFKEAISWAGHKKPKGVFYANLGWFYLARCHYDNAKITFQRAISENEKYFRNYWGIGRAYIGLGNFQAAADALRTALNKAEEAEIVLQPPTIEEIPELLRLCEENLRKNEKTE